MTAPFEHLLADLRIRLSDCDRLDALCGEILETLTVNIARGSIRFESDAARDAFLLTLDSWRNAYRRAAGLDSEPPKPQRSQSDAENPSASSASSAVTPRGQQGVPDVR